MLRQFAAVCFLLTTLTTQAVEFNDSEYHIYLGDLNGDGIDDIYLREPDGLVLLHGDIVTPITIPPLGPSYAILSNGSSYASPVEDNDVDISGLTELTSGYSLFDQNGDGILDLYITQTGGLLYNVGIAGSGGTTPGLINIVPPSPAPGPYNAIANMASLINTDDQGDTDDVGSAPGSFRVDESGAATYSIPIPTAAGTAGVVPQLSLNYSSQGGNGLLGLGWSIGGLSGITRCRQTLHQDRDPQPITWSSDDRFCLDGQRLLLASGTYGAAGSTYKTEIDSFAKIIAKGGTTGHPAYFQVERKDGSVSFYGNSADSKQQNSASQTLTWAINKFQDSVGNPIEFIYDNDVSGHRIKEVRYAYGSTANQNARIVFGYNNRPDDISGYVAGYEFKTQKRLARVISYSNGAELRRYELTYQSALSDIDPGTATIANNQSRLDRIEDCLYIDGVNDCLPATTFDWSDPQAGFASIPSSFQVASGGKNYLIAFKPADINGDGIQDLTWLEAFVPTGSGDKFHKLRYALANADGSGMGSGPSDFTNEQDYVYYAENPGTPMALDVIDYNADGRTDVIVYNEQSGIWKVYLSTPQTDGSWKLSSNAIATPISNEDIRFADINSDGLVDAIAKDGAYLLERNSNSSTSDQAYSFSSVLSVSWPVLPPDYTAWEFIQDAGSGDFNGDGAVDLVAAAYKGSCGMQGCLIDMSAHGVASTVDTSSTWNSVGEILRLDDQLNISPGDNNANLFIGDLNSDGLADILYGLVVYNASDVLLGRDWFYQLNTGAGFSSSVLLNRTEENEQMQLVDINSDTYPDLLWHDLSSQKLKARLWNSESNSFGATFDLRGASDDEDEVHMFFDTNGDGVLDYVRYRDEHFYSYLGNSGNQPKNLITQITNGLGAETDISYENLGQSDHYGRVDVNTTTECQTINISWQGGNYEYCTTSADDFYSALNGDWDVTGNHLEKHSPVLELHGPIPVVTRVDSSAPAASSAAGSVSTGAKSAIEYRYREAKIQASGRGLLGFHSLITQDLQTGITTTTQYRQDWPFIGYPQRTEVRSGAGHLLSESENTWEVKNITNWSQANTAVQTNGTADLGALQPYILQSVEKTYTLSNGGADAGTLLQTVTTDNTYDDDGNPTLITVTTAGGGKIFQKITANEYTGTAITLTGHDSPQTRAELGRLSKTTVTSKRDENGDGDYIDSGDTSETRVSSFSYYTSNAKAGLLKTEVIEPSGGNSVKLTTTHDYDTWGNRVKSVVSGWDGTATVSRCNAITAIYDSRGRYIETTKDCLGRTTSQVISRNSAGQPTQVKTYIDINGTSAVTTHYAYTDRGIRYLEASDNGAWSGTTLHSGRGVYCPTGTQYHSKTQQAGGGLAYECFDLLGRSIRTVRQGFAASEWVYQDTEYDPLGRIAHKSEPYFSGAASTDWTVFAYDILGRVTGTTLPDESTGSVTYNGFVTTTTNDHGQTKTETQNALGEVIQVKDNLNNSVYYRYDAQGNMTTLCRSSDCSTDPNATEISYDLLGRKIAMDDPDKGTWVYDYNAFGELIEQTDAKGQTSELFYDGIGRLISRIDRRSDTSIEGNTSWVYDVGSNGLGQLHTVEDSVSGYLKEHSYDSLGRPSKTLISLSGSDGDHYEKVTYDEYSRPHQIFDAARNDDVYTDSAIQYRYNAQGYRDQIKDASTVNGVQTVYQTIQALDARGNVTSETRGNNVTSGYTYDDETGRLQSIYSENSQASDIQDLRYAWDTLGNLNHRHEYSGSKSLEETFSYDGLNRLKTYNVVGGPQKSLRYNSLGNIVYKSDVCNTSSNCYTYGAGNAGPHAVTAVNGSAYTYDANGNNLSGDGRSLTYTTFDKVSTVSKGNHTTTFAYGPDRSRYKRTDTTGSGTRTTLYLGSVEKITQPDGSKQVKRYIGGIAILTQNQDSGGNPTQLATLNYLYKDHLGSTDVITDAAGNIAQSAGGQQSFDAWGQRRSATNWQDISDAIKIAGFGVLANPDLITTRGFTGHEMVDEVGIVHMNGRIYDPRLGRFLQADPHIQSPTNTQSLNRYSYVYNNPLNATDPSGFFVSIIAGIVLAALEVEALYVGIVVGLTAFAEGLANGMGFFEAVFSGVISGVSAGAFTAIGAASSFSFLGVDGLLGKSLAMGVLGGITNVFQGGKFGHGFVSAGFGALAGPGLGKLIGKAVGEVAGRVLAGAVIGGTLSKVTGGKFANGAAFGAFAAVVSLGVEAAVEYGGTDIEYFDASENGAEFSYEERIKLGEALKTQGDELTGIINKAKAGDPDALAAIKEWFGESPDFDQLTAKANSLSEAASNFKSYKFRKLGGNNSLADGGTRAYACVICRGNNKGTIYLSKTAFNDVMTGSVGKYTLIHEVAHLSYGFGHGQSRTPYRDVRGRSDNYGQIYAYQGLLRGQ